MIDDDDDNDNGDDDDDSSVKRSECPTSNINKSPLTTAVDVLTSGILPRPGNEDRA